MGAKLVADPQGRYATSVAPRGYTITASAMGYRSDSRRFTAQAGSTTTVDLKLFPWASTTYLPLVLR